MKPLATAAATALLTFSAAEAKILKLDLTGALQPGDALNLNGAVLDPFGALEAFSFRAVFDTDGTVYRAGPPGAPLPGYAAYDFIEAQLTVGGVTYEVASFADDPVHGVAVALFDPTNVFNPGFYGVGFFGNPLSVGAGLTARFDGANTSFSATAPGEAMFEDYLGYGALSGPTIEPGPGIVCQTVSASLCSSVPIFLTGPDGQLYDLTLLSAGYDANGSFAYSASISEVPLPGGLVLFATALGGAIGRHRLARRARPSAI
jgi:hypothetical protein